VEFSRDMVLGGGGGGSEDVDAVHPSSDDWGGMAVEAVIWFSILALVWWYWRCDHRDRILEGGRGSLDGVLDTLSSPGSFDDGI